MKINYYFNNYFNFFLLADGPSKKLINCERIKEVFLTVDFGQQKKKYVKKNFKLQQKYNNGGNFYYKLKNKSKIINFF